MKRNIIIAGVTALALAAPAGALAATGSSHAAAKNSVDKRGKIELRSSHDRNTSQNDWASKDTGSGSSLVSSPSKDTGTSRDASSFDRAKIDDSRDSSRDTSIARTSSHKPTRDATSQQSSGSHDNQNVDHQTTNGG